MNKRNELTSQQLWEALNKLDAKVMRFYCVDYNYTKLFMIGAVRKNAFRLCYLTENGEQPKNVWVTRY